MTEVQSSYQPSLQKFQGLLGDLEAGPNFTVDIDGRTIGDICRDRHSTPNTQVSKNDAVTSVWSSTQIILALIIPMLVDRGFLDLNEKLSKYWPEYVAEVGKDAEVRDFISHSSNDSGFDKLVTIDDISELVRRTDGRSLEHFIAEEVSGPLRADLHQQVAIERQHEDHLQSQPQQLLVDRPEALTNALKNSHAPNDTSEQPNEQTNNDNLTKLYPETIPTHRLHPYARDFSVVDQGPIGKALLTHRRWQQGDFMARFDGLTVPEVMLHTLQKTDRIHLWDPHFIGNLAHSCNPNVMLDMAEHEMWAVRDIEPGTVLSMDYASTEDHLYRTFQCQCSALGCRGEVTGRKQRRTTANRRTDKSQGSI